MYNSPCINCKKPMNGGVYRKPNECPHCSTLQDTGVLAVGKIAVKTQVKPAPKNTLAAKQAKPSKPISATNKAPKSKQSSGAEDELAAALAAHRAAVAAKKQRSTVTQATSKAGQPTAKKTVNETASKNAQASSSPDRKAPVKKTPQNSSSQNKQKTRASIALAAINKAVEAEKKRSN